MKTILIAGLLGSTLLASGAMAQSSNQTATQPSNSSQFITQLNSGSMLLSDLMDQDVVGPDNKDIGDVEDVILSRDGKVAGVVIEVDEGMGDRTVALPMSAFKMSADAETTGSVQGSNQNANTSNANMSRNMNLMLNMPVDQLKSAPEFDND